MATLQLRHSSHELDAAVRHDAERSFQIWPSFAGALQCPTWLQRQVVGSRQRACHPFSGSMRGFAGASEAEQQSTAAEQAYTPPGRVQNAPAMPWTPTQELRKRNFLPRRMGHLMQVRSWRGSA